MVGSDQRNRLTPVADHVVGEHRLVLDLETVEVPAGHVCVCEHGMNTGHCPCFSRIDRSDAGVRVWAASRRAPQHAVGAQVGRVSEVASHFGGAVRPADALANPHLERAAIWTASMIFVYPVQRQMLPARASRI